MRNIIVLAIVLISGCKTPADVEERHALVSDPEWLSIQALVKDAVIKREGLLGWETGGYTPVARKRNIWVVVASANYPLNTLGHNIDIEIATDGTILRYVRRWEKRR